MHREFDCGLPVYGSVSAQCRTLSEGDARQTGVDAYVFGFPLVSTEVTRRVMTDSIKPEGNRAPMGVLKGTRQLPVVVSATDRKQSRDDCMAKGELPRSEKIFRRPTDDRRN